MSTIVGNVYKDKRTNWYRIVLGIAKDNTDVGSVISDTVTNAVKNYEINPYYFKNKEKVVREFLLKRNTLCYYILECKNEDFLARGFKNANWYLSRKCDITSKTKQFIRHVGKEELDLFLLKAQLTLDVRFPIITMDNLVSYYVKFIDDKKITIKDYTNKYLKRNCYKVTHVAGFSANSAFVIKRYKKNEVWFVSAAFDSNNKILAYHLKDFGKKDFYEMLYYMDKVTTHDVLKRDLPLLQLDFEDIKGKAIVQSK